ncbi:MAG: aminoacyl-tRNA hydrolase [Bacillales bacterium]|nr:aminoacyl-tRNA hydrolase [Bacillales bacterium]
MKLIVGLGNPGQKYADTRHNMGFLVIDEILKKYKLKLKTLKHFGIYLKTKLEGQEVILLKPLTFMNDSGLSIVQVMSYYKIAIEDVLVIYDDMDTEPGSIRLRLSGSAGGHNGLKSIISHIGENFKRIRVGIGKHTEPTIDYVLSRPTLEQEPLIEQGLIKARDAVSYYLLEPFDKVMSKYNEKKKEEI